MASADSLLFISTIVAAGIISLITIIAMQTRKGDRFLCDDCKYNNEEACKKSERPQAISCVAYKRV